MSAMNVRLLEWIQHYSIPDASQLFVFVFVFSSQSTANKIISSFIYFCTRHIEKDDNKTNKVKNRKWYTQVERLYKDISVWIEFVDILIFDGDSSNIHTDI